jgi:hypothetical protein
MAGAADTTLGAGSRRSIRLAAIAAALAAASFLASPAAAQQPGALRRDKSLGLSLTTGADFSSGRYGAPAEPTSSSCRSACALKQGPDPGTRRPFPGCVSTVRPTSSAEARTGRSSSIPMRRLPRRVREGLGDVSLGLDYVIPSARPRRDRGRARRAPQASHLGKGPGARHRQGRLRPGRRHLPPDRQALALPDARLSNARRSRGASSCATARPSPPGPAPRFGRLVAIGAYDYAGATSPLSFDSHSLFGALAAPVAKQVTLTGYGTAGLSRGAPDYGVGLLLTFRTAMNKKSQGGIKSWPAHSFHQHPREGGAVGARSRGYVPRVA